MENYEQKYKAALNWMRSIYPTMQGTDREDAEHHFPELKEHEDEKIRKGLIKGLSAMRDIHKHQTFSDDAINIDEAIAWLERQGQEKSIDMSIKEKAHQIAWETSKHYDPLLSKESWCEMAALDMAYWLEKQGETSFDEEWIKLLKNANIQYQMSMNEDMVDDAAKLAIDGLKKLKIYEIVERYVYKQSEKKPTDKVEPKFKIGDWITNGEYTWKVTDIKPLDYDLQSQNGDVVDDTISYVDEYFNLWTIQDAEEGDVLSDEDPFIFRGFGDKKHPNNPTAYCGINVDGAFILSTGNAWWTSRVPHPATKEQRDLLFKKMKEAGYEWDAEKKELKKIESKPAVWSEEDEKRAERLLCLLDNEQDNYPQLSCDFQEIQEIKDWLKSFKDRVRPQTKQEWSKEDKKQLDRAIYMMEQLGMTKSWDDVYDWLKSIKPNHWKPSEEQMRCLKMYLPKDEGESEIGDILKSLYEDLKKL